MVKLKALRQLSGDYIDPETGAGIGKVAPGQPFEVAEDVAKSLEGRGLAERWTPKKHAKKGSPENKALAPEENKVKKAVKPRRVRKRRTAKK